MALNENVINFKPGEGTIQAGKKLSNYIKTLPLDALMHDELVSLIRETVCTAEREAFIHGFTSSLSMARAILKEGLIK